MIEKYIIKEPQIFVFGVYCKTKKEQQFYKIFGEISIIYGIIGTLGFVILLSYFFSSI